MPVDLLKAKLPPQLLTKLRDKFAPRLRLRVRLVDGVIPYDKNDLVAVQVGEGRFERGEIAALLRLLPAVSGFIDVGANLGFYSLLAARRMAAGGRIIAFEASPIEYRKLMWTIRANKLTNVTAVQAAVSDVTGNAMIHESLSGAGALNRLDRAAKETGQWRATQVDMTSLDAWFRANEGVPTDLMKIDVEGHELPVLLGARDLIARDRPVIMIEMNPSRASDRSDPTRIWSLLSQSGYRWNAVVGDEGRLVPCNTPSEAINLFAVPVEPKNRALVERLVSV